MLTTLQPLRLYSEFYPDEQRFDLAPGVMMVFGSNLAGRHGKGAAKTACHEYGAVYGRGEGLVGQSYAIPTKDHHIQTLPLIRIASYVEKFVHFTQTSDLTFFVTAVGCGLAGYQPHDMAPLFRGARRCYFPESFVPYVLP